MRKRISLRNSLEDDAADFLSDTDVPTTSESEVGLFEALNIIVRKRRVWLSATIGAMLLMAVVMLLTPNTYKSNATILPSGDVDNLSGLKSLAGLTGMLPSDENSSQMFPIILQSRAIRDAVLDAPHTFSEGDEMKTVKLSEYFDSDDRDQLRRSLSDITSISISKQTGVIDLTVETEYPGLSQTIARQYLTALEQHNLHRRRSEAGERVTYLSRELPQRTAELQRAEDALSAFRESNSNWASTTDPELLKLLGRLERDVSTKERTVSYLRQELEAARLDAQKDIPIVRVLDSPSLPTQKAGPPRTLAVLMTGIIAWVLAVGAVLAYELALKPRTPAGRKQVRELERTLRNAIPGFDRTLRMFDRTTTAGL